ncbi:MAG: acyl-CoA reductase [Tenuifilaceae bacterium]
MDFNARLNAFIDLGKRMLSDSKPGSGTNFQLIIEQANNHNPWFTPDNVYYAIDSIANHWLSKVELHSFVNKYPKSFFEPRESKKVVVIMAGNVPFAGFHDLFCVLLTGHHFLGKVSSKDGHLMNAIIDLLVEINPEFRSVIELSEVTLHGFDAVIATGSDSSSQYFDYYFKKYPKIIRRNRNSIAILTGNESEDELKSLGDDIFLYFGLGCRSISKLMVPKGYNFNSMLKAFKAWQNIDSHNKYMNNYEFQKTLNQMNLISHIDTDFFLLKQHESISSTVGVLHYQEYESIDDVKKYLELHKNQIQCIVADAKIFPGAIPFGMSQNPAVDEFADGMDTIEFLSKL